MIIVEFKRSGIFSTEDATKSFNTVSETLKFILDMSLADDEFELIRINKYSEGKLIPYEITTNNGRIALEEMSTTIIF